MPELILMVGESGSGKSYAARQMVSEKGRKIIRLNRDDMRMMMHNGDCKSRDMEKLVSDTQTWTAAWAARNGYSVIIDDTNLNPRTRARWASEAVKSEVTYKEIRMDTPLDKCVARDNKREGKAHVGEAVIHRQFLESGRLPIDKTKPIAIVDVDGTLSYNDGHRSFYDEELVQQDAPIDIVVRWVQELAKDHTVIIVSGRHSTCGDKTIWWLRKHGVPFEFIFMRHAWDDRDDRVVKKEILDSLLNIVHRERIALVLDDRPKVVRMWKENGLKVIPVAGACEEF